jgi:hypothetical protein
LYEKYTFFERGISHEQAFFDAVLYTIGGVKLSTILLESLRKVKGSHSSAIVLVLSEMRGKAC